MKSHGRHKIFVERLVNAFFFDSFFKYLKLGLNWKCVFFPLWFLLSSGITLSVVT